LVWAGGGSRKKKKKKQDGQTHVLPTRSAWGEKKSITKGKNEGFGLVQCVCSKGIKIKGKR